MVDSTIIYLRNSDAEEYFTMTRGPERHFLGYLKEMLILRAWPDYPLKDRLERPSQAIDLLFVYAHTVNTVKCFRSDYANAVKSFPVDYENKSIIRVAEARELMKTIQIERCKTFVTICDSLLGSTPLKFEGNLDLYWLYRLLITSLSADAHFDKALSRPEDFELTPPEELEWG